MFWKLKLHQYLLKTVSEVVEVIGIAVVRFHRLGEIVDSFFPVALVLGLIPPSKVILFFRRAASA